MSFANIFTHSVDCLFILLVLLFGVWKLLSLIRSHLFIFAFVSFARGDRFPKKYCYNFHQRNYISAYIFFQVVMGLALRSLIHLEFIFVYGMRKYSTFILSYVTNCSVFPAPLIEKALFSPLHILASFVVD